jgi:hypothetical protein
LLLQPPSSPTATVDAASKMADAIAGRIGKEPTSATSASIAMSCQRPGRVGDLPGAVSKIWAIVTLSS